MAYKKSNEKTFKISKEIEIECYSQGTSYGFRHVATLLKEGYEEDHKSMAYYNRTWESFTYESVLFYLVRKTKYLTKEEKEIANKFIKDYQKIDEMEVNKKFGMIANIAKLGDLFADNQKDKNSWKERMLKAGLENKGLEFPSDWETLSEEEKEIRLNNVINNMKG